MEEGVIVMVEVVGEVWRDRCGLREGVWGLEFGLEESFGVWG